MPVQLRHQRLMVGLLVTSIGGAAPAFAGSFSYVEIPPGLAGFVFNTGVSGDGKVAVGYSPSGSYYWTPLSGVVYTGGVSPGAGGVGGRIRISEDGTRMGGQYVDGDGKANAAFFTLADFTWTLSPNMGASCDISRTSAWDISRDGSTLVGLGYWQTQCTVRPSRWKVGDAATLPLATWFGWQSRVNGCNSDGSIMTGWQAQANGQWMACMWKPSGTSWTQVRFSTPAGLLPGEGQCMNGDASRVFGYGWFNSKREPFMWTPAGGAVSLGPAPIANYVDGFAVGCSRAGDKVCCFFRPGATPLAVGEGYMWIEGRGYVPLEQYAAEHGVTIPEGFHLAMPLDMSPDGLAITGNARSELGGFECTFVLDLHPEQQPCPADLDGNRLVNGADLGMLLGNWGGQGVGDLNGDGTVDGADLGTLLGAFGPCP